MRLLPIAAAGALWASAAHADPLTLADAIARARASAPSVTAKTQALVAARAAVIPAGALPDPKVSLGVTDFPISGPLAGRPERDNFSTLSFGFSQDVPNRAKRRARVASAEAGVREAQADEAAATRAAGVAAGQAWVALYYAERKLAALDALERTLLEETRTAPARLASGADRPALGLAPRQLQAALADRRETLRAEVVSARADLQRWIGDDPGVEPGGPAPDLTVQDAALRTHLDTLPALQLAEARVRRAEAAAGEARAEKRPDWAYDLQYDHRDPRFGDYISGRVHMSLPLFSGGRQDPLIAARLAEVNAAVAEREVTRRELAAALEGALAQHAMHHAQLMRAREVLVPLAKQRADLEEASYRAGAARLAEVLAARREAVDAELMALDREAETAAHVVSLQLTYGSGAR